MEVATNAKTLNFMNEKIMGYTVEGFGKVQIYGIHLTISVNYSIYLVKHLY